MYFWRWSGVKESLKPMKTIERCAVSSLSSAFSWRLRASVSVGGVVEEVEGVEVSRVCTRV